MRVRVKTDQDVRPTKYLWAGSGFNTIHANAGWTGFTYHRAIHDVLNSEVTLQHGGSLKHPVKPVLHVSSLYYGSMYQPWLGDNGLLHVPQNVYPAIEYTQPSTCIPPLQSSVRRELCLEAFNSFSTQFPQELSLAETISGLRELEQLIPKFRGDILEDLAGLHLTNSFGWSSMASDIKALGEVVSRVEARLHWLRKTYGRPTRLGFYQEVDVTPTFTILEREPVRSWGTRLVLRSLKREFRAGATLFQLMTHLDDAIGMLRGFIGAFGLDNPIKAAWEIMPFSFAVDYFFNVSSHLDRLTRAKPGETWDLTRLTHSCLTTAVFDVIQVNKNQQDSYGNTVTTWESTRRLGELRYRHYERSVGLPVELDILDPVTLSPDQLVLLGAIWASNSK